MKKSMRLSLALLLGGQMAFAQVSGNVTVGTSGATYPSLTGAGGLFAAINSGGLSGNVTATILSNLTEDGSNTLSQWTESPAASNFTLTIVPGDATAKVISGTLSGGLVSLTGADRVTFDGRFAGSGRYLTFVNTATTSAASTISMSNDAQNNTISYCNIKGAGTTSGGNILIGASTVSGGTGNDNNTITYNIIGDAAGTYIPYYLIRVNSSNTTVSNDNGTIAYNEFVNWQGSSTTSGIAVYLTGGSNCTNNWMVQNNAIYQTAQRISALYGIYSDKGANQTITDNKIGGSDNTMGGTAMKTSQVPGAQGITFTGIYVISTNTNTPGVGGPNTIANNQITNFQAVGTASVNPFVFGIFASGANNIYNNIIGSSTAANSISSTGTAVIGIFGTAPSSSPTLKNIIKGNTITNLTSTFASNKPVVGILIGSTPINIPVPTAGVGGLCQIDSNIIDGMKGNNTSAAFAQNSVAGVIISSIASVGGPNVISRNIIKNIINTNTGNYVHGGINTNTVVTSPFNIFSNQISNIYTTGSGGNKIYGIAVNGNTNAIDSIYNNAIAIGANNPATNTITGLADFNTVTLTAAAAKNFFNNTVLLSGNQDLSTATSSYAFSRSGGDVANITNNLFINKRTGINSGGSGAIYAMYNTTTTPWNSDYNMIYSSNPATLVYWNATSAGAYNFEGYQAVSQRDTNALTGNVPFMDESNANLHINSNDPDAWNVFGRGMALATINTDLDGVSRSTTMGTPISLGAYEIPIPSSIPADMTMTPAMPTLGTPTVFTSAGRKIAEINWTGAVVPGVLSAKYYPGVPAPNTTSTPNINSYFEVNSDVSTAIPYTIKTYYTTAEIAGITDANLMGIKSHTSGIWTTTTTANSNAKDLDGRYLQSIPLTDFSTFTMNGSSNPLAINLSSIAAVNAGNKNRIDWSTATENKTDYFELESSTDARNFTIIAKINAKGTASDYTYTDEKVSSGVNYYRLKMTLESGSFSYSKTVTATVLSESDFALNAYPNPVQHNVILTINGAVQNNAVLVITDATGKVLQSLKVSGKEINIDMHNFESGIYIIKYSDNQQSRSLKVIKQ